VNHGTMQGVWRHKNQKEPVCEVCLPAWAEYVKEHPPKNTRAMRIDSPDTSAFDKLLDENPPVIVWRKNTRGVFMKVTVHDPHQDTAGRRTAA
jgi:hypothetical protein